MAGDPHPRGISDLRIHREAGSMAPRRRRGPRGLLLVLGALVLGAGGFLLWQQRFSLPRVALGRALLVEPARDQQLQAASGHLLARRQTSVAPDELARLVARFVDVGDVVEENQVLGRTEHEKLEAEIEQVSVLVEEAQTELQRQETLAGSGITQEAELDAARFKLRALQARLRRLQIGLEQTYLRAPFAGTVIRRDAEIGQILGPASFSQRSGVSGAGELCVLVDMNSLEVEANVSEAGVHRVHEGLPAQVTFPALPGKSFRGEVRQVLPRAERQRGIVPVRVRLLETDERLVPDLTAQVVVLREALDADQSLPYVTVPTSALRLAGGSMAEAFVYEEGSARRVLVQVGRQIGDRRVVESGLEGGETLVLRPPADLVDGDRVRIEDGGP